MKILIDDFITKNDTVLSFLNKTGRDYENADIVVMDFATEIKHSNFNPAFGIDFANILQLLNSEEKIISQYDLEDISRLLQA